MKLSFDSFVLIDCFIKTRSNPLNSAILLSIVIDGWAKCLIECKEKRTNANVKSDIKARYLLIRVEEIAGMGKR